MRNQQELKFFEKAIKILKDGYGYPCVKNKKDLEKDCIACRAQETIDFLKEHIATIKWDLKNKK